MPNRRVAAIAFGIFIVLLAIVTVTSRQPESTELEASTPVPAIITMTIESLRRLELTTANGILVLIHQEGGDWTLEAPVQEPANSNLVESLISTLLPLNPTRALPTGSDPAAYGLDAPEFTVTFSNSSGEQVTIEVGSHNPDETKRYVRLAQQEDVYLVHAYQLDRLAGMVLEPPIAPTPTVEQATTAS